MNQPESNFGAALNTTLNRRVLQYLHDKSAHSDVTEALTTALKPLGDLQFFCPDREQYRYVVASTRNVIFAFAVGMNTIAFRLDERMKPHALASGAESYPDCGEDWVAFTLFRDDWPKPDLEFWARKSYAAAREASLRAPSQ
jgi:hypothetical protein